MGGKPDGALRSHFIFLSLDGTVSPPAHTISVSCPCSERVPSTDRTGHQWFAGHTGVLGWEHAVL